MTAEADRALSIVTDVINFFKDPSVSEEMKESFAWTVTGYLEVIGYPHKQPENKNNERDQQS